MYKDQTYRYHSEKRKGWTVSTQHSEALQPLGIQTSSIEAPHDEAITLEGLEHVFRWASEVVSESEDTRVRQAREKRIRRQVLEIVQKFRDHKILGDLKEENAYLQRRVIALLQKLQEVTEENATAKQIVVSQYYALQRLPELELEIKQLKAIEFEREAAVTERRYLMNSLAN